MRPPFQAPQPKLNKALITRLTTLLTQAVDFQNKGDNEKAKSLYQEVVKLQPGNFDCWHILGIFEYQNKNYEEALKLFRKVISINPRFAPVHSNMGLVLQDLKRYPEAIASYDKAIALDNQLFAAYNNRGNAFKDLGQLEQALKSYACALTYQPDYPEALYNLAEIYKALQLWDNSLTYYDRTIYAKVDYAEAHNNRGLMLQFLNRVDDALQSFNQTIAIWPDYAPAHSNKSLALLLKGNYKEGWEEHEWRWKMKEFTSAQRNFPQPQWTGQGLDEIEHSTDYLRNNNLIGKTILVHCEQGIGDTLQFCRYIPYLVETGAQVRFEVQASVFSLMRQIISPDSLIKQGDPIGSFDYHCPLISLPYALRNRLGDIPAKKSYLKANELKREKWSNKLGIKRKPRIGIVWSGNIHHHNDLFRSLPLQILLPYLNRFVQDFELVCLQNEFRVGEREFLMQIPGWIDSSQSIEDFEDTAALCELVDLVITVDTSVAHLSGAMGTPTWLMLPFAPDWRWLMDRTDSPWYPSFKLYRQNGISDWKSVLDRISKDLNSHFGHII